MNFSNCPLLLNVFSALLVGKEEKWNTDETENEPDRIYTESSEKMTAKILFFWFSVSAGDTSKAVTSFF